MGTQLTIVFRCRLGLEGLFSWAPVVCHLCAILGVFIMKAPAEGWPMATSVEAKIDCDRSSFNSVQAFEG